MDMDYLNYFFVASTNINMEYKLKGTGKSFTDT